MEDIEDVNEDSPNEGEIPLIGLTRKQKKRLRAKEKAREAKRLERLARVKSKSVEQLVDSLSNVSLKEPADEPPRQPKRPNKGKRSLNIFPASTDDDIQKDTKTILHGTSVAMEEQQNWSLEFLYEYADREIEDCKRKGGQQGIEALVRDFRKQLDYMEGERRRHFDIGLVEADPVDMFQKLYGDDSSLIAMWGMNVMTLILLGVLEDDEMNGFILEFKTKGKIVFAESANGIIN
eukprot:scaffold612_cov122-Ochromonas_danica.AAC.1